MKSQPKNRNTKFAIIIILTIIFASTAIAANTTLLYGHNGTDWVPLLTDADGTLKTDMDLTEHDSNIIPAADSTYNVGSSALRWLAGYFDNLYTSQDSYFATTSGSVGVGTTAPAEKLEVNGKVQANAFTLGGVYQNAAGLTHLLHPSQDGGYNDLYKAGWRPAFFNQQWGGAFGGEYPNGVSEEAWFETGYINGDGGAVGLGPNAGTTWTAAGFMVSRNITVEAVWLKLYKVSNPQKTAQPLEIHISSAIPNGATDTIVANGNASKINGHDMFGVAENWPITSNTDGEWYKFTFDTNPSLAGNTTYYLVAKATGANANSFGWEKGDTQTYPHGSIWVGDDATPTNWVQTSTRQVLFLIESADSDQFIQSDTNLDIADSKYVFNEGLPLDQSKGLTQPLKNFFNDKEFTTVFRGANFSKDKTIVDFLYGLDHDRVVLRADSNGYAQLTLYQKNESNHTISGTSDISDGSDYDIGLHVRMRGDGSDFVYLYINGSVEASLTSQTFVMDDNFKDLGTAWLGGGFPLAPVWTDAQNMTSLPSADGDWAWAGTGTEANATSVQNGKLYQNKNGYGSTDTGYYTKGTGGLSNANGWEVVWKTKIGSSVNTPAEVPAWLQIQDGAKTLQIMMHEYYIETANLATNFKYQINLMDKEHIFRARGKGSDFFLEIDGKLVIDATGLMTSASGTNAISFGDGDASAGDNADVTWDYFKHYTTEWIPPEFTNASLHEFAFWSGNKSVLFPLIYNSGGRIAVKDFVGVDRNYMKALGWEETRIGITSNPTTTSSSWAVIADMEAFVMGDRFRADLTGNYKNSVDQGNVALLISFDGEYDTSTADIGQAHASGAGNSFNLDSVENLASFLGLHKIEGQWATDSGTGTNSNQRRRLIVKQEAEDVNP